jgi:formate dehydrogenase
LRRVAARKKFANSTGDQRFDSYGEGVHVGDVAAGRIGLAVLRRLKPFDMHLHYYERHRLPDAVEKELNLAWHPNVEDMVTVCDVVTINAPLGPETENLFNDKLISKMKWGAYLVNTARAKICARDAIVRALESGQLAGYAADVWFRNARARIIPGGLCRITA